MVSRYTAANFAFCFHAVVLALWSSSSVASHFALFLMFKIVLLVEAASADKTVILDWEISWVLHFCIDIMFKCLLQTQFK